VNRDSDSGAILRSGNELLKKQFGFFFVTLQIEDVCLDESGTEMVDVTRSGAPVLKD
jgi:cobalt-zinc-cadmium efflux system protein